MKDKLESNIVYTSKKLKMLHPSNMGCTSHGA